MAAKKEKYVVNHDKLYLSVGGKLKRVPKGTPITITTDQATAYGDKVLEVGPIETVDVTGAKKPAAKKPADPDVATTSV